MFGFAQGGNDTLIGGNGDHVRNTFVGDADDMNLSAQGGNDILIGGTASGTGSFVNVLYGDAQQMTGSAHGATTL
jgi:hypothetical protein